MIKSITSWLSAGAWFGLAAAIPAVLAEYLYRTLPGTDGSFGGWLKYIWIWIPFQLAIGFFIYKLVNVPNTTLLDAFIVWAFATTFMRVLMTVFILGDPVKGGTWFALALLVLANVAKTFWGR